MSLARSVHCAQPLINLQSQATSSMQDFEEILAPIGEALQRTFAVEVACRYTDERQTRRESLKSFVSTRAGRKRVGSGPDVRALLSDHQVILLI